MNDSQRFFLLLCLCGTVNGFTANITNITTSPNPAEIDRFPLMILVSFTVDVTSSSLDAPAATPPTYLDSIVEVCPPHPYEDHCFVFPAGKLNRSAGHYHSQAKIAADNAWWLARPGDFTKGRYTTDLAVCDGNCVKWLQKPVILAETHSTFDVADN